MKLLVALLFFATLFAAEWKITTFKPANQFGYPAGRQPITWQTLYDHLDLNYAQWADPLLTRLSCSDSRGTTPRFGAPGGDFGAYIMGLEILRTTFSQALPTQADHDALFAGLMNSLITTTRKFYFHTDRTAINSICDQLMTNRTTFDVLNPDFNVVNKTALEIWLTTPDYQGCDHIKNMLLNPDVYQIKSGVGLIKGAILAFFHYAWASAANRQKIAFEILEGTIDPQAVAIIDTESYDPGEFQPLGLPTTLQRTVSVYHPSAAVMARKVLSAYFVKVLNNSAIDTDAMDSEMEALDMVHSFLTLVGNARNVPWFNVWGYFSVPVDWYILTIIFVIAFGVSCIMAAYFACQWRCLIRARSKQH